MNREEKKKLIAEFCEFNCIGTKESVPRIIDEYLDSLEMKTEKAIELLLLCDSMLDIDDYTTRKIKKALQFAIDYMKDEGEIIGWINYYPDVPEFDKIGGCMYRSPEEAKESQRNNRGDCIQIPIRKPR